MDRDLIERRLALLERRLSELEHVLNRQCGVVSGLEAVGRGRSETAEIARELLRTMELNFKRAIAERKWLRVQLRAGREAS
jgi:hypothetical protein